VNYSDPTGFFKTLSEAIAYSHYFVGARILWAYDCAEWFLSLDEYGLGPYISGPTVTRFFGNLSHGHGTGGGGGGIGGGGGGSNMTMNMRRIGTGVSSFSVAMGAKDNLIVWGVRSGVLKNVPGADKLTDVQAVTKGMGKTVGNYYKVVKGLGYVSALATAVTSGVAMYDYAQRGDGNTLVYVKGILDIAMAGVGCLGLPGYIISTAYFVADTQGLVWKFLRYKF
jgi:hypothetical protein